MADYTVIVDDLPCQPRFRYEGSWAVSHLKSTYRQTVHNAMSSNANMSFSFIGGREIIIRGNFVGQNNASESTAYPIFEVKSQNFLKCSPNPPENGGQFLCSAQLDAKITNRTLTMFVNPNVATQQFYIDYIRHGSSSEVAASDNETVVFVKAPNNTTPGLAFDSHWKYQSVGGESDTETAMHTSTTSASATYNFVGNSLAWWACCLPVNTSSNAANVTYSIDAGDTHSVQVDQSFIQNPQCKDQKLLFQIYGDQLQPGNHTLQVSYGGDNTKMPLTLCGLAASPSSFRNLDIHPSPTSSSSILSPSGTSSAGVNNGRTSVLLNPHIGVIAGTSCGGAVALVILLFGIIWWKRKRDKRRKDERRLSDTASLSPFVFHPVVGFLDMEKQDPTASASPASSAVIEPDRHIGSESMDTRPEPSRIETRPPSYRSTGSLLGR